jgi:hypothetical protein
MNLFYNPSMTELRQLLSSAKKSSNIHNVVIDFDGEVIIDPEVQYEGIALSRFKFHTQISQSIKNNARGMKALFDTLLAAYNGNSNSLEIQTRLNRAA